jgi:Kef-type K+ transport system membrane component KefB
MRVAAVAFLTPFFFLRGVNVSLGALVANPGVLAVLVAAKMVPKLGLVFLVVRGHVPGTSECITLLMSTGLTIGRSARSTGSTHIIDRARFSLLVTIVLLLAIVPIAKAQTWDSPDPDKEHRRHAVADPGGVADRPADGTPACGGALTSESRRLSDRRA